MKNNRQNKIVKDIAGKQPSRFRSYPNNKLNLMFGVQCLGNKLASSFGAWFNGTFKWKRMPGMNRR